MDKIKPRRDARQSRKTGENEETKLRNDYSAMLEAWKVYFSKNSEKYLLLKHQSLALDESQFAFRCNCCGMWLRTKPEELIRHTLSTDHKYRFENFKKFETVTSLNTSNYSRFDPFFKNYLKEHQVFSTSKLIIDTATAKLQQIARLYNKDVTLQRYGSTELSTYLKGTPINIGLSSCAISTLIQILLDIEKYLKKLRVEVTKGFLFDFPYIKFNFEDFTWVLSIYTTPCKFNKLLSIYYAFNPIVPQLCLLFRQWFKDCKLDPNTDIPPYVSYLMVICYLQSIGVIPVIDPETFKALTAEEKSFEHGLSYYFIQLFKFYVCLDSRSLVTVTGKQTNLTNRCPLKINICIEHPYLKDSSTKIKGHTGNYFQQCLTLTYLHLTIPRTRSSPIFRYVTIPFGKEKSIPEVDNFAKEQYDLNLKYGNLAMKINDCFNEPQLKSKTEINHFINLINFNSNWQTEKQPNFKNFDPLLTTAIKMIENLKWDRCLTDYRPSEFLKNVDMNCKVCKTALEHINEQCIAIKMPKLETVKPLSSKHNILITDLLEKIFFQHHQNSMNQESRELAIASLNKFVSSIYVYARLTPFGSSRNGFGLVSSDIDVTLTFADNPTGEGLNVKHFIKELTFYLRKDKRFSRTRSITGARVPIIKLTHSPTNFDIDISIYNTLAIINTSMLRLYSDIDIRAKMLGIIFKRFISVCNIGNSEKGDLSSYSYILMLIYFLQRTSPPILPVLQEYEKLQPLLIKKSACQKVDNESDDFIDVYYYQNISQLQNWEFYQKNKQTVGELWIEFLIFYSEKFDYVNDVVSIRKEKKVSKFEKLWNSTNLAIEDPFDISSNLSSRLSSRKHQTLIKAFILGRNRFLSNFNTAHGSAFDYYFASEYYNPDPKLRCIVCGQKNHSESGCPKAKNKNKKPDMEVEKFKENIKKKEIFYTKTYDNQNKIEQELEFAKLNVRKS